MAEHDTPLSMLNESLPEMINVAQYCVSTKKITHNWGQYNTGGCLGYPGAIILFSIIDSMGSYLRKNHNFKVPIDGSDKIIKKSGYQHFYILNSKYFNQKLGEDFIKRIYDGLRSRLVHNAIMGKDITMIPGPNKLNEAFFMIKTQHIISLVELYDLCKNAIDDFLKDAPNIVPQSKQGKKFH